MVYLWFRYMLYLGYSNLSAKNELTGEILWA